MTRADWARVEPLLDALLDAPPEKRAALLTELSAGDRARRADLERLVADCERESPLLERPVGRHFAALFDDDRAMPPALAERYQPLRELGRGGMATVYLARDLKHSRDVAVKIVRPEVAAALGTDRFLREITIVSQLQHPHIVPLFDSGRVPATAGGEALYYVMPYLDGRSLRDRLARDGPLPIGETVTILRDVCDALAHAHAHGIVHRDIKPDNVLLSGRHALVSDFGVARAVTASAGGAITDAGVLLGTPTYMAPEQAAGDRNVDHRADIYALGVLAYEVLAGRPPFAGDAPQDIVSAHLIETPLPLTRHRPEVPLALADLVMTCLAKRPTDRWQSATDLLARLETLGPRTTPEESGGRLTTDAIRSADVAPVSRQRSDRRRAYRWVAGAVLLAILGGTVWALRPADRVLPAPPAPAIAVLVFQHDPNPESESLALGLTSDLIGALGSVARIDVRSLAAVLPYRDRRATVDSIGRRLDVRWLIDGRVSKRGDSVIVVADLTDASTGRFSARRETSAASNDDVSLIERLVPAVAGMLRERLGDEVRVEAWRAGTRSDAAFNAVNRAHKATIDADFLAAANDWKGAWASLRRADSALSVAASADRGWAEPPLQRAWVARKIAFVLFGNGVLRDSVSEALRRGVEYAEAARRVAPEEPRALEAHGVLLYANWLIEPGDSGDSLLAMAEQLLTAATDTDTTLARGEQTLGAIYYRRGEFDRARLAAARAYSADAYADNAREVLGALFSYSFADGEDAEARRWCRVFGETFPAEWSAGLCRLHLMAWDSTAIPHSDSAWHIARVATAAAEEPIRSVVDAQLTVLVAGVLARLGSTDSARRVLDAVDARARTSPDVRRDPFDRELLELEAGVRVLLREPDAAIALLAKYLERRPDRRPSLSRDRRFRTLRINEPVDAPARSR